MTEESFSGGVILTYGTVLPEEPENGRDRMKRFEGGAHTTPAMSIYTRWTSGTFCVYSCTTYGRCINMIENDRMGIR